MCVQKIIGVSFNTCVGEKYDWDADAKILYRALELRWPFRVIGLKARELGLHIPLSYRLV